MRLLLLALTCACAPLNTATMSEPCRYAYKACMARCPGSGAATAPETAPARSVDQVDVAICTRQCNDQAQDCR